LNRKETVNLGVIQRRRTKIIVIHGKAEENQEKQQRKQGKNDCKSTQN